MNLITKLNRSLVTKAGLALLTGTFAFSLITSCNEEELSTNIEQTVYPVYTSNLFTAEVDDLTATFRNYSLGASSFYWEILDSDDEVVTTSEEEAFDFDFTDYGVYTVNLTTTDAEGETDESSVTIYVASVAFSYELTDATLSITNESIAAASYEWDFGDGSVVSTDEAPDYTYSADGDYTVTLTAYNADGIKVGVVTELIEGVMVSTNTEETDDTDDSNKYAIVTDTDAGDTGELRYTLPSGLATGKIDVKVNYSSLETESFYVRLFNTGNSTSSVIADLKMDEGNLSLRDNGTVTDANLSGTYTTDEFVDVSITWDNSSTTSAGTYSVVVAGTTYGPYTSENESPGEEVTSIAFVLASNSKLSIDKVLVDDLSVYSDVSGTAEVFSDDFEGYSIGDSLDTDNVDSPYNSATFDATVGGTEASGGSVDSEEENNFAAQITDTDAGDTGELRYTLPSGLATGKLDVKVNYSSLETESFYVRLFNTGNSTSSVIADLKMDEGNLSLRDNGTVTDANLSGTYTMDEFVDVSIIWDNSSTTSAGTYSVVVAGTTYGPYTSENENPGEEVTSIAFVLASNSKLSIDKVLVDDLSVYSDVSGTTEVFSDDFEDYAAGDSLDTDNVSSPYNSATFDATVVEIE